MSENKSMRLNDEVWHRVIQFVQLAMLTGVDVADYLRQIRVTPGELDYVLADDQKELFDRQIGELMERVKLLSSEVEDAPKF